MHQLSESLETIWQRESSFHLKKISLITMPFHCRHIDAQTVRKFRNNTAPQKQSFKKSAQPLYCDITDKQKCTNSQKVQKQYDTERAKFLAWAYQPSHYVGPSKTNKCTNCQKVKKQYSTEKAKFSVEKYQPSHHVVPLVTNKCISSQRFQKQYGTKFSVEKDQLNHYVVPLQTNRCINCQVTFMAVKRNEGNLKDETYIFTKYIRVMPFQ